MSGKYPEKEFVHDSPSRDHTRRYPEDILLRKHGYRIHSRPRKGEAIWERGGELIAHGVAVGNIQEGCEGK